MQSVDEGAAQDITDDRMTGNGVDKTDYEPAVGIGSNPSVASSRRIPNVKGYKDTGYSWVILGTAFADYCLLAIGLGAMGVLYPHIVTHFQCSMYEAGWIGSLHMAVGALMGLFVSPVLLRFGSRPVAMAGSIVGACGYCSSYLSQTVGQMYLTFGLFAGIGNGLTLIASSVILQQYFDRKRTLATAFATMGFGLSPLVVAPLTQYLTETLGWRMTMLLLGCAYMQGVVVGSLMRPAPVTTTRVLLVADHLNPKDGLESDITSNGEQTADKVNNVRDSNKRHIDTVCSAVASVYRALNLSLLIDIRFVVMTFSTVLSTFGYFAPFMFLPSYALKGPSHLDERTAARFITIVALSMLVGRVASGIIGDRMSSMTCCPASCRQSKERRLFHYALPMAMAGLANAGVALWSSKGPLIVYSSVVGFFTGSYIVMQQPVLIDLLGLQQFAGSYSLFMMFNGISALACQPIAGWLADVSGSFALTFFVCGLLQATGGLMLIGFGVVRAIRASHVKTSVHQLAAKAELS